MSGYPPNPDEDPEHAPSVPPHDEDQPPPEEVTPTTSHDWNQPPSGV